MIGVDEVGRGPIAGPVVTCAVLWPDDHGVTALNDSKKLSAKKREALVPLIREKASKISFGRAEVEEIDSLNILHATMLAMERAVAGLGAVNAPVRIDGNRVPDGLKGRALAVVGGDGLIAAISAASILAKVARDEEMVALAEIYPGYGLERHAGYPTRAHIEALETLGVSPIHRRSFGPVKSILENA
jgi:ribonuclease HII